MVATDAARKTTTTERATTVIITAKFASVCPCCSNRITAGSKVEWSKGSKAMHLGCAAQPGAKTAAASSPTRASDGRTSWERRDYAIARRNWDGVRGSASYYSSGMYDEES